MPEKGIDLIKHEEILTFEEIVEFTKIAVEFGIDKVRITGGEPLVRRGIVYLVKMISEIEGIKDFAMTTNGVFLDKYAKPLAEAGLHRVNISLDTLDPVKFRAITRVGNLNTVLKGIETAQKAGLLPIKINCVIKESPMEKDAREVAAFCKEKNLEVRFIKEMDLETGVYSKVIGGDGGHCAACNRLRLMANGKIKPCLFSNIDIDVKEFGVRNAILKAIGEKPESGSENKVNQFSNIGG